LSKKDKNHFELLKVTKLKDIMDGTVKRLDTSDLSLQNDESVAQYKFVEGAREAAKKYKIYPGCYTIVSSNFGTTLEKFELKTHNLLETIDNTKSIKDRANQFFDNLHVYEELVQPKIRNILLYSAPGFGKSSAINSLSQQFISEDPNTVVINWTTSAVRSSTVESFFSIGSQFDNKVSRMIFIIEDIGGGEQEYAGNRGVDSSLLGLLDGNSVTFKVPTFTLATTNYPANLLGALADRPGRFDEMVRLGAPTATERSALGKFLSKRDLTEDEIEALEDESLNKHEFSIAHIKEIVIRSRLSGKSFKEVIGELVRHKEKYEKGFDEKGSMGLGI